MEMNKTAYKIPIKFTESALKEIKHLKQMESEEKVLHVGVKNGGCSGLSYIFEFTAPNSSFQQFDFEELSLQINPLDLQYIENLEVDYKQGLNNRGFTFTNPNAQTTCGCGTSFA